MDHAVFCLTSACKSDGLAPASTEMMKNHETIIQVVRKQKQDKLINVLRILSMLSYFLDQIAFLKKISEHGGDLDDKGAISDERWNSLVESTDPKVTKYLLLMHTCHCHALSLPAPVMPSLYLPLTCPIFTCSCHVPLLLRTRVWLVFYCIVLYRSARSECGFFLLTAGGGGFGGFVQCL